VDAAPEFPSSYARTDPVRPAVIDGRTGSVLSYQELEDRSRRLGHVLRAAGLRTGDHIALLLDNRAEMYEVCWAAQRCGLYYTAVNTHLSAAEAAYIVNDCGATVLLVSDALAELAAALAGRCPRVRRRIAVGAPLPGHQRYADLLAAAPGGPLEQEREGEKMLYSSGTTGRPKGVLRPLSGGPPGTSFLLRPLLADLLGIGPDAVFLAPAPLYHAAPLAYSMGVHRLGGTVVITGRFDAEQVLRLIERYAVTHALFVPTNFVRMLRLDPPARDRYRTGSLRVALHGAAPCPPLVKRAMIDWLGPVLVEYYSFTEGGGMTAIDTPQWLAHPGSVGRPVYGQVHIVAESGPGPDGRQDGPELGPGRTGAVYFSGGTRFSYHNDPAKTAASYHRNGWSSVGDIGHLDAEGYLYLTDRKAFTIISGGVNIYPQEAENVLAAHPAVADVAVFGVPDAEMGEQVKAVVQLTDPAAASPGLARELIDYTREHLAGYKCPRSVDFRERLPRAENGKLYKQVLRAEYAG
jgi:long-chain acyl-CoA synthetase